MKWYQCQSCDNEFRVISESTAYIEYCPFCGADIEDIDDEDEENDGEY